MSEKAKHRPVTSAKVKVLRGILLLFGIVMLLNQPLNPVVLYSVLVLPNWINLIMACVVVAAALWGLESQSVLKGLRTRFLRATMLVIAMLAIVMGVITGFNAITGSMIVAHQASISLKGHTYQLAGVFKGICGATYILYECDAVGIVCSPLHSESECLMPPYLKADENTVYLMDQSVVRGLSGTNDDSSYDTVLYQYSP